MKFFLFLFLLSFNLWADCTELKTIGNYPKPVLIAIPANPKSIRIHFHGHILGMAETRPYENFPEMLKAFGIESAICKGTEVVIIPQSTGKNTTYKEFFKDKNAYVQFLKDVHSSLDNKFKTTDLHLSAHSGGGKYVAAMIGADIKVSKVSIFDGIYDLNTKDTFKNWFKEGGHKIMIATIQGMDPDNFTIQLRSELSKKMTSTKSNIGGSDYVIYSMENFIHYSRSDVPVGPIKAHFEVVTQTWPRN